MCRKYVTYMWGLIFPFFWEWKFCGIVTALEMFVARVPNPPISTTGHAFIEIVYRVLCCRLNELFISELHKKISCGHTLLFVLLPDDGPTWSKGRFSSRIMLSSSGLGERLEIQCGLSSSSTSIIVGVVHFRFLVPDPRPVVGRVFERSTEAS